MHIGINAQLLSLGQSYRNSGVSRYIRYLLMGLAQNPGEHSYTIFVNGQAVIDQLQAHHPQITYVPAPWPEEHPAARIAWEQMVLPSLLRQRQVDVFHSLVNVLPEWLPTHCATILTLHDLAFLRFPHVLTRSKRLYHRTFTMRSLQRATMVVTVSDSTQQDAHDLVHIPYERMQTVYPCIDTRFSHVIVREEIENFRTQKGLTDGFILYLGTLEPRKNLPTLLEAYAHLRQQHNRREKLVLAGSKGWLYDTIFEKVRQLGLETEVIFPGFVPDREQALWYQAAKVFAYPSLYEGFGMPVAEALACGIPVVTSTISSLPEAGANIALTIDPHDIAAMTQALYQAITDEAYRTFCQRQAQTVLQKFSTQEMAQKMLAVYAQAAARQTQEQHKRTAKNAPMA